MDSASNTYRDRWFIDDKKNITGPLTTANVIRELMDGKISVSHRVSFDGKSWAAICNTEHFETALRDLGHALAKQTIRDGSEPPLLQNSQVSEVSTIASFENLTEGISEQLDHARHLGELVASTQKINSLLKELKLKKRSVRTEQENTEEDVAPEDEDVFFALPKKFPSLAALFKGKSSRRARIVYVALLLLVSIGAGIEFWNLNQERAAQELANKKLEEAQLARLSGDYGKAISSFQSLKGSKALENLSTKELLDMADAHAQGNDYQQSEALIAQAQARANSPAEAARANALSGMIAMRTNKLESAAAFFEKAVKAEPLYPPLHNLGIIRLKQKKYGEAEALLLKALAVPDSQVSINREATLFGLLEVAIELDQADRRAVPDSKVNRRLSNIRGLFEHAAGMPTKRAAELKLAQSVIEAEDDKADAFRVMALDFIDAPRNNGELSSAPSAKIIRSLESALDESVANWTSLYRLCMAVYNKNRGSELNAAFYGACLARTHGAEAALPYVRFAHLKTPGDPIYAGLFGALLFETKKSNEALQILGSNIDQIETGSRLGWKTLTQICEQKSTANELSAECQAVRTPASERMDRVNNAPGVIPAEAAAPPAAAATPLITPKTATTP